jgi:hypothetical protein
MINFCYYCLDVYLYFMLYNVYTVLIGFLGGCLGITVMLWSFADILHIETEISAARYIDFYRALFTRVTLYILLLMYIFKYVSHFLKLPV